MCGIAGILHYGSVADAKQSVNQMTNALVHRGPDAEGFYDDFNISFGHRRLSIVDLSPNADQPFIDTSRRYVLVFNGMIYNYSDLKCKLSDYPFTTSSDTEVLMASFCKWGIDCVQHLEGMFAFAIWDNIEHTLWLARDRMGIKPLFYYEHEGAMLFASEKRALLASGKIKRQIDKQSLFEFLSLQSTGYPNTMILDIKKLNAGYYMKVSRNECQKVAYWKPTSNSTMLESDPVKIRKTLFDRLNAAVVKRMVSDVPLGVFLSGGIDSTAILSLMSLNTREKINTFTLAFNEKKYDESDYAQIASKRFGSNHTRYLLQPERFLDLVLNGLDAMDSPSADGINTYVLSGAIRSVDIKVAISGIGGDELFAGYPGFIQYHKLNKFNSLFRLLYPARKAASALFRYSSSNKLQRLADLLSLRDAEINMMYPVMRQILSPGIIHDLIGISYGKTYVEKVLTDELAEIKRFESLSQYSLSEYMGYAQTTLLKDTDQMSMAVGLEIREPFFDHHLVEYVLSLPDQFKYPTSPKKLLVDALRPLIPQEIVNRRKQGFEIPWKSWMQNELHLFCEKQIQELSEREFINGPYVLKYWNRFVKGDPSVRWIELWQMVVLSYWLGKNGVH